MLRAAAVATPGEAMGRPRVQGAAVVGARSMAGTTDCLQGWSLGGFQRDGRSGLFTGRRAA